MLGLDLNGDGCTVLVIEREERKERLLQRWRKSVFRQIVNSPNPESFLFHLDQHAEHTGRSVTRIGRIQRLGYFIDVLEHDLEPKAGSVSKIVR